MIYSILDSCLDMFDRENLDNEIKDAIEYFISISYFRINRFQIVFLKCLQTNQEAEVGDFKNLSSKLEEEKYEES